MSQPLSPLLEKARETAQEDFFRRDRCYEAESPGGLQQIPVGQRHQARCAGRVSGREDDREIVEGDLAPRMEAVSLVILDKCI